MDAMVLVVHQQLRKHHTPLRVHRTVGDPVLVAQRGGTAARQYGAAMKEFSSWPTCCAATALSRASVTATVSPACYEPATACHETAKRILHQYLLMAVPIANRGCESCFPYLWMMKVLVRESQVAVVCISTALLPAYTARSQGRMADVTQQLTIIPGDCWQGFAAWNPAHNPGGAHPQAHNQCWLCLLGHKLDPCSQTRAPTRLSRVAHNGTAITHRSPAL